MATWPVGHMTNASPEVLQGSRAGFSLLELIMALTILSVGALAMAGTTVYAVQSITLSELATNRSAARQSTVERIMSQEFDSVAVGTDSIGPFVMDWTVGDFADWKAVEIVTMGPGRVPASDGSSPGGLIGVVTDTLTLTVLRP